MKSRLHKIEITNFKAFRHFSLNLEGRHLLVYGDNGAGKSSLYWALYTFLQSARKPRNGSAKYFDPANPQNLLNIHEQLVKTPLEGEIAVTLKNTLSKTEITYRLSKGNHGTFDERDLIKGDLASDFITYRFFFGFSDFKNSEKFDVWPLFEREVLPFCVSTSGGQTPFAIWNEIRSGDPNPEAYKGVAGSNAYARFHKTVQAFAGMLPGIADSITLEAQRFYDTHFGGDDHSRITLKLGFASLPSSSGDNQSSFQFKPPVLEFGIQVDGKTVSRPQSFLNEAKLTQLALSVRFGASLVNLHESDLKLLVLDDLLVSLDMSNRMKVVEILLTDPALADYQKIILTHDRGLFEEFRRMSAAQHTEWCFRRLQGNPKEGIDPKEEKDALEKAADYLTGHDLEAAALQLRKAAEDTAQSYLKMATGKAPKPGEFHSLSQKLEKAKNILLNQLPLQLFKDVCAKVPKAHRDKLVRMNDNDIDAIADLTPDEKNLLKQQREKLTDFMTKDAWKALEAIDVLDAVIQMKDRVLNPAAHWAETPLYTAEVNKALTLVERLKAKLLQ
jgi:hypothetical protein